MFSLPYVHWDQLNQDGKYSVKLAAFGPLGIIGGRYLFVFPSQAGKPAKTKVKVLVLMVFVVGVLAGLVNWYLMRFFGR
ncbi:MAG: hypothetical protein ABR555_02250 [Pyrinomonadaceae bacterium]